jgi:hypothetical protein
MEGKTRVIFPVVTTGMIVLMVTLIATVLNLGFTCGLSWRWMKAYASSWPVASVMGFLVLLLARRTTRRIVMQPDGTA